MRLAQLVVLPTVINTAGQYITRCGEVVTVTKINRGWANGYYPNGIEETWDISGRLLPFSKSDNDITLSL